jgi:hypothetical protein
MTTQKQTLVQISRTEMKNILSEVNTSQFISFESKTPQKMNKFLDYWLEVEGSKRKNSNPTPNPFMEGGIYNRQHKIDIVTGFDYERSVNGRREKEGKESDFVSGEGKEPWFNVISKGLVTDKRTESKFYLRYQFTDRSHMKENEFTHNDNPIEKQMFEDYLVKKNTDSYSNQGLDNPLNFQVCDLKHILTITMNHVKYVLTD